MFKFGIVVPEDLSIKNINLQKGDHKNLPLKDTI